MNYKTVESIGLVVGCPTVKLIAFFFAVFSLFLSAESVYARQFKVIPVLDWNPVLVEFQVPDTPPMVAQPPFIRFDSRHPSVPADWEFLKELVKIKPRGSFRSDEDIIVSGWRLTDDMSRIEVMRSDNTPEGHLPIRNFLKQQIGFRWISEIWGEKGAFYRFSDRPELTPADEEYQQLIKEKITITDFSLILYQVEGPLNVQNIRNDISPEPLKEFHREINLSFGDSLKRYESHQGYGYRPLKGIYELQLKLVMNFPELDEQKDTSYPKEIEACIRFLVGDVKLQRIYYDSQRYGK